jgi:hypothetical protein
MGRNPSLDFGVERSVDRWLGIDNRHDHSFTIVGGGLAPGWRTRMPYADALKERSLQDASDAGERREDGA